MKVLLIDPWGTNNTAEYLSGLIYGLSLNVELTVFTNCYFKEKIETTARINRIFFKKSEKMNIGKARKIIRGIEYYLAYNRILKHLKDNQYDVIHINWLLQYSMDIRFLNKMKGHTNLLVYTAHNVLPHINGFKCKQQLHKIYSLCDKIVLHGEYIKKEFTKYFPEYDEKVYIQKHGSNLIPNVSYNVQFVSKMVCEKIESYKRIYLCFGRIFYNKGFDRLKDSWKEEWKESLLIIAGKISENYERLEACWDGLSQKPNVLFLNEFIEDNTLNYLLSKANIILLPYRHASMSGVVFTAADFAKPILCTNVGALSEYLNNNIDSFIFDNTDEAIIEGMKFIEKNVSNDTLAMMGLKLQKHITESCAWNKVATKLVKECYIFR